MTTLNERAAKLRERVNQDYAQKWDFNEIPDICGVVESIRSVTIEGENKLVATIAEVDGAQRYGVWLSQAALFNRFSELRIREGELVAIKYLGEADHAERGKSPAKRFRVEVDRPGGTFEWDRFEGTTAAAPQERVTANGAGELVDGMTRDEHEAAVDAAAAGEYYDRPPVVDDIPY